MNNERFFPKNNSARAALCVLLCVPLIAAAIVFTRIDPNKVETAAAQTLTVTINGHTNTFTDEETFAVYSDITKNSTEIDATFRDFSAETPYEVTFSEVDGSKITYSLYMLEDENDCIYKTGEDKYYMMDPECAKKLLVRPEFGTVNTASFLPVLTYTRGDKVLTLTPDTYSWNYKGLDGNRVQTDASGTGLVTNPIIKLDSENVGAFAFNTQPDSMKLRIMNGTETVFDDVYENLTSVLSYKSDTKLEMTVVAEWYSVDGTEDYSGTLTYKLDALYDIKPTYSVVDDHALPKGDFTILRMSDFNDGEALEITGDPDLPKPIGIYDKPDENIKFAFIPFSATSKTGDYTLTLTTEDNDVQTVEVGIKEPAKDFGSQTLIVTDTDLQSAFTSEGLEQWYNKIAEVTKNSANSQLWKDKFSYPTTTNRLPNGPTYGMSRDVKSLYSSAYVYDGACLDASEGDQVTSANDGVVVFAGELTLTGKTIIIDHGSGVLTYYGHLSDIGVDEGQAITKDAPIGFAGSTGFACGGGGQKQDMVYFGVSIGGVMINPSSPCRFGINF